MVELRETTAALSANDSQRHLAKLNLLLLNTLLAAFATSFVRFALTFLGLLGKHRLPWTSQSGA